MKKLQILVCAHKADDNTRNGGVFTPIQVGKALHSDVDLGYICDNIGDNISERNPYWCEWTALYWGWKNIDNVEYLGLNHYRRYFDMDINENNIDKLLEGYDIIAVKSSNVHKNSRIDDLAKMTSMEDAWLFIDELLSQYPDIKKSLLHFCYNSNESFPFSMFIAKKELYNAYCEFIFPVLFEMEKKAKLHGYARQKRMIGYLGEWSLGIFIYYKHLKVRKVPYVMCGEHKPGLMSQFKKSCKIIINRLVDGMDRVPNEFSAPDAVKVGLCIDGIELMNV